MKTITSVQNPEIKAISQLSEAKERYKQGRFIAEGSRVCSTLIQSPIELIELYILEELLPDVLKWCTKTRITIVSPHVAKKISQTATPSGIVGLFKIPSQPSPELLSTGIVLVQIADPGNMGTLIRTCAALGKKTVILINGVNPWNAKVVQASAGSIGSVNIFNWEWQEVLQYKKKFNLIALVAHGGKNPSLLTFNNDLLIIGSEAYGIPETFLNSCDEKITLPMPGGIESLNAAVAGSIAMYFAWIK